ncbi:MAG: hypothetical protein IMZ65_00665, partial [Planctomycetes bacterium]|nr:hypothetical protein [Planctomycetota bacterium]
MTTSNGGVWRYVAHRLGGGVCRFHRCQRGQAIFVVVLFFFLLAGLLFLVLNSGEKLNHKVMMQGAADSATTTGAAWFARGLNTISMCNVAETQLLSLIVLLDTLETVIPVAKDNIDAYVKDYQNVPNDARVDDWLVVGDALEEQKIIHELYQIAYRGDSRWFPEYCNYDTGVMWECIKLMDGFSHSMEQVTPLAAQREAMQIAKKNHAEFGFVLPLWPELPVVDGQFNDFRDPMVSARMPQAYGHELIGGFAWVMNYRGYRNQVMGPWSWWREPFVSAPPLGLFDLSGLSTLFRLVSQRKLDMLFGSGDSKICLREWEYDYDKAKGLPRNEIIRAWWDRTSFDARYPYPQDSFFSNMDLRHEKTPPVSTSAYPSMDRPNLAGYTRSSRSWEGADGARNVWYRVTERQTAHYPELGIFAPHPPVYPDGSPWPYTAAEMKTYYHVQFYRFQGAEKGLDMDLH